MQLQPVAPLQRVWRRWGLAALGAQHLQQCLKLPQCFPLGLLPFPSPQCPLLLPLLLLLLPLLPLHPLLPWRQVQLLRLTQSQLLPAPTSFPLAPPLPPPPQPPLLLLLLLPFPAPQQPHLASTFCLPLPALLHRAALPAALQLQPLHLAPWGAAAALPAARLGCPPFPLARRLVVGAFPPLERGFLLVGVGVPPLEVVGASPPLAVPQGLGLEVGAPALRPPLQQPLLPLA